MHVLSCQIVCVIVCVVIWEVLGLLVSVRIVSAWCCMPGVAREAVSGGWSGSGICGYCVCGGTSVYVVVCLSLWGGVVGAVCVGDCVRGCVCYWLLCVSRKSHVGA